MAPNSGSVDPSRFPDEAFALYSIPAFDYGRPERFLGREIGSSKQVVQPNDVLLSRIVPHIRRAWVVGEPRGYRQIASGEWIVFRSTKALPSYLRYLFVEDRFHAQFMNTVAGVGGSLLRARPAQVADIEVPLPSLPEQQRIAGQLEQADRLRRTRRYALELTAAFLPAAFLELFGDQTPTDDRWPTELLGEHLEAIEGGVNFNPVGENDPASDWRVLKVSAVSWSDFLAEESKPISPSESFSERLIVQRGDLIMSRANTTELVGAVARVRKPPPKVLLPDKLWRLKLCAGAQLLPDYLLYALRSRKVRREIEIRASGTSGSMKNISKEDVRELRLPQPPFPRQEKFADLVEGVERLRAVQREALRQAEHLFQTLLHHAFSESIQLRNTRLRLP